MITKINMYRLRSLNASTITLLIVIGLLVGGFIVRSQYEKNINIIQNELHENKNLLEKVADELDVTREELLYETNRANELNESLSEANIMLEEANATINDLKSDEYRLVYMGDFKITYYCDERYSHICGGNGVTASGKKTEVGVTAAADWSVLPKGSKVYIEGIGWREIQDVGGSVNGKHIDVLVKTHQEALNLGTDHEGVWLLVKK